MDRIKERVAPISATISSPFRRNKYDWLTRLHAGAIALGVRVAAKLGYLVVLVGVTRSGKTYILERALPGMVLNKTADVLKASQLGYRPNVHLGVVSDRAFAIDELDYCDPVFLGPTLEHFKDRGFAIAVQSHESFSRLGIEQIIEKRKRVVITLIRRPGEINEHISRRSSDGARRW